MDYSEFLEIKSNIPQELVKQYVQRRMKGIPHRAALLYLDDKLGRSVNDKEEKALIKVYDTMYRKKLIGELLTSDDIPDRLGMWEPVKKKKERDKLYQQRLQQNPELKNNIKKIGEQSMKTTVTYKSDNASAISRQWHLMFTRDDKTWNSWDISNIKSDNSSYMFTLISYQTDSRLNQKDLESMLVAGVDMSITKGRNESKDNEDSIKGLIELDLSPEQMADILLADDLTEAKMSIGLQVIDVDNALKDLKKAGISAKPHAKLDDEVTLSFDSKDKGKVVKTLNKMGWDNDDIEDLYPELLESFTEAEVPDDEDAESDTIDDVQSMLTKMLPKTKGLKLGADKEKELKATLKKAMSLMGESDELEEAGIENSQAFMNVDKHIQALIKYFTPTGPLAKGISKQADNVVPEFKKMQSKMYEVEGLWDEVDYIIGMSNQMDSVEEQDDHDKIMKGAKSFYNRKLKDMPNDKAMKALKVNFSSLSDEDLKKIVLGESSKKTRESILNELTQLGQEMGDYDLEEGANKFSVISLDGKILGKNLPLTKAVELSQKHKASLVRDEGVTDFLKALKKEAVDYPQFQFAIAIPRDDYQNAAKVLNDSNIDMKTRFAAGGMAILGFDYHNETGRGNPNVTEDEIVSILSNVGIAASVVDGSEFNHEPLTMEIDD